MKPNVFGYIKIGIVLAVVTVAAIPVSNLLVAQPPGPLPVEVSTVATVDDSTVSGSSDAVSALMAGNVIGRSRGCSFGLRRPASAFVP
jgi:hypothetical protein